MKIVVCGSMTASKEMVRLEQDLRALGHEVVLPEFTHEYADMDVLDKMHTESARNKVDHDLIRGYFDTIKNGDSVLIFNIERRGVPGYIGGNSFLEMGFAFVLGKPIYLMYPVPEMGYSDELHAMNPIILDSDLSKIG